MSDDVEGRLLALESAFRLIVQHLTQDDNQRLDDLLASLRTEARDLADQAKGQKRPVYTAAAMAMSTLAESLKKRGKSRWS